MFQQIIKVLGLQEPTSPKNGEFNVGLRQTLKWPKYQNSQRYKIYVWKFGSNRNEGIEISQNYYYPSVENSYPQNTKMLWQVEFILNPGYLVNNVSIVPSPIWGFVTQQIPDFKVVSVKAPSESYTGRTLQVSWVVTNIGTRGNSRIQWYDRVFLTKDKNANGGEISSRVRRQGFIFPSDGYTGTATLSVPDYMIGSYYVRVSVDIYHSLSDIDRTNNLASSSLPIEIKLTPPPDLQVTTLVIPTRSFSGMQTNTVKCTCILFL